MSRKFSYVIEVKVPNGAEGWQNIVNNRMRQALDKLKATVEELGGTAYVRY